LLALADSTRIVYSMDKQFAPQRENRWQKTGRLIYSAFAGQGVHAGGENAPSRFKSPSGGNPHMTRIPLNRSEGDEHSLKMRLEMSTAEIGLSVRTTNCLEERGIFTVQDLLHCTPNDLLSISNFGEKTLDEVYKSLEGIGFYRTLQPRRSTVALAG